jgi:transposase
MRKPGPKRFTDEFRREAVRLMRESDRPVKELAAELGVSVTALRNWERTVVVQKSGPGRVLSLEEQVRQLRRENERLREEREILKKATAFFARDRQ